MNKNYTYIIIWTFLLWCIPMHATQYVSPSGVALSSGDIVIRDGNIVSNYTPQTHTIIFAPFTSTSPNDAKIQNPQHTRRTLVNIGTAGNTAVFHSGGAYIPQPSAKYSPTKTISQSQFSGLYTSSTNMRSTSAMSMNTGSQMSGMNMASNSSAASAIVGTSNEAYQAFSNVTPSEATEASITGESAAPRRLGGFINPGDVNRDPESPIGEPYALLTLAVLLTIVITIRKKLNINKNNL